MINSSCDHCLELQKKWYKKLLISGFNDAEDYRYLHIKNTRSFIRQNLDTWSSDRFIPNAEDIGNSYGFKKTILDSNRPLKSWHSSFFARMDPMEIQSIQESHDKKMDFLRTHNFKSEIQKKIWELHCEGLSSPEIEKKIKSLKNAKKQLTIRNIIKELEREFV